MYHTLQLTVTKRGREGRIKSFSDYSHFSRKHEIKVPGVIDYIVMKRENTLDTFG